jgi:hypothetical protein
LIWKKNERTKNLKLMANSIAILAVYTRNLELNKVTRFFIAVTNINNNNNYYLWQNYEESQQKKYEDAKN